MTPTLPGMESPDSPGRFRQPSLIEIDVGPRQPSASPRRRPVLTRPIPRPGRVLYVAGEGAHGLHQRIQAWEYAWGHDVGGLTVLPQPVQLQQPAQVEALAQLCAEDRYRLVVLDTLARCLVGADENSARDIGIAVDAADRIRRAAGATVLLVHHTGKDGTNVRGSSALEGAMDTIYTISGDPNRLTLERTKRKDGPRHDRHMLALDPVLASCVVVSNRHGHESERTENERKLLSAFLDHFADTGASKSELRSIVKMPSSSFHRALKSLVRRGDLVNTGTDTATHYRTGEAE
ncbi:MAG: AAA family ATPase [Frankiaceae bacterium]